MTDDLIIRWFYLYISRKKSVAPEKAIWCDIFFHFIGSHTKTVIDKLQSFLFRIYDNLYFAL